MIKFLQNEFFEKFLKILSIAHSYAYLTNSIIDVEAD
jgi:hypothetical protein